MEKSRSSEVKITSEIRVDDSDEEIPELGILRTYGFDQLYGIARLITQRPSWATADSSLTDNIHQLEIALRRNRLIAIHGQMTTFPSLRRWVEKPSTDFALIASDILAGTFNGDGKMLWMKGVHRRRATKADTKAYSGSRLQEAIDALDDATYLMSAMSIELVPEAAESLLQGRFTVSPDKSHVSFKSMTDFPMFLTATDEALGLVDKSMTGETPPEQPYPELAVREKDLRHVRGAYAVTVATAEEIASFPHSDEATVQRAELLRRSILDVSGSPSSPDVKISIGGPTGAETGILRIRPIPTKRDGFIQDIKHAIEPSDYVHTNAVKDALEDDDLLTVYYESGHIYTGGAIARRNLSSTPFMGIRFDSFDGYNIMNEKPRFKSPQDIHDHITSDDDSLFSWVVKQFSAGWLVCDDGSGEIADFLHLDDDGTLTAIHVKSANNATLNRGIAVARFEELVSQAEKNMRNLDEQSLISALSHTRIARPACWREGNRIDNRAEFIEQIQGRPSRDKTYVLLVQPHILESKWRAARDAIDSGQKTKDTCSLILLDTLLHSTRKTVISFCDDLIVVGCR